MRQTEISRKTKETDIKLSLCLEGGDISIDTGIGFFDHMLNSFATHAGFGLELKVKGDLYVDEHHTVEDTGIVLGKAFSQILKDKSSIDRFGSFYVPMDEALAFASVDISGRPFLVFECSFNDPRTGGFDNCLTEEFMRAFAFNAGITLHLKCPYGSNDHHKNEAMFKALAHALKAALVINGGELELYAEDDCLDSNGNLIINGGTIKATKTDGTFAGPFGVIDPDGQITISEKANLIFATGRGNERNLSLNQNTVTIYCSEQHSANEKITVSDKSGNTVYEYSPGGSFGSVLISSEKLKTGEKYVITIGDEVFETEITEQNITVGTQQNTNNSFRRGGVMR